MAKKYFFNDLADFKNEVSVTEGFNFIDIVPNLKQAGRKYLRNNFGIGKELFDAILADYQNGYDSLSDFKKELTDAIRIPVGNFAMYHWAAKGSLTFGADGITKTHKEGQEGVKKWERDQARKEFLDLAFEGVEDLLEFLEDHSSETYLTGWKASDAFTTFKESFLKNVKEFSDQYPLVQSRRTFLAVRHIMKRVQTHQIKNIIGYTIYDAMLVKLKAGTALSDDEKNYMESAKPCLAYLTMAEAFTELSVEINEKGVQVLSMKATSNEGDESQPPIPTQLIQAAKDKGLMYLDELKRKIAPDTDEITGERLNDSDDKVYYV
jgi:hypothetical protein